MKAIFSLIISGALAVSGYAQTRNVLVGTNNAVVQPTNFWSADASNARTGLGLGTAATNPASAFQPSSAVLSNLASSNGGTLTNLQATNIVGVIPSSNIPSVAFTNLSGTLSIAQGGTGATNAANARQNLGSTTVGDAVFIATNAAAARTAIGALSTSGDAINLTNFPTLLLRTNGNGSGLTNLTAANITGTVALASNVTGTIAISNGGSGATTAGGARTNLGLGATNDVQFNTVITRGIFDDFTNEIIDVENYWLNYPGFGATFEWGDIANTTYVPFAFGGTNAAVNAAITRTNLGLGWPALTNTTASGFQAALFGTGTNPVLVNTNGEVVSPTNFWQAAPINTRVQISQPVANATNNATNARNLFLYSLAISTTGVTNTIQLPTNGGTFLGDVATIIHEGPTSSITAVRQIGAGTNLIALNQFQEAVKFIYESGGWRLADNISYVEPIYFSGTNAAANAAASRTNLGLGQFKDAVGDNWAELYDNGELRLVAGNTIIFFEAFDFGGTNAANFREQSRNSLGLGITNDVRFNTLQFDGSPTQPTNFSQLGLRATASGFGGFYSYYDGAFKFAFAAANLSNNIQDIIVFRTDSVQLATPLQFVGTNSTINAATTRTNLGLPLAALTNTSVTNFQKAIFYTNTAPSNVGGNLGTIAAWIEIVASNGVTYKIPAYTNVP